MESLEKLYLVGNELEALPDSIGSLRNLQEIYLTKNRALKALPGSIADCASLNKLYVNECNLESLPTSLPLSLEILHVSNNQALKDIPGDLASNVNLKFVHLANTSIDRLDPGLEQHLNQLRAFDTEGCPLDEASLAIAERIRSRLVKPWTFNVS